MNQSGQNIAYPVFLPDFWKGESILVSFFQG